jgi:hypothetical protein
VWEIEAGDVKEIKNWISEFLEGLSFGVDQLQEINSESEIKDIKKDDAKEQWC